MKINTSNLIDETFGKPEIKHGLNVLKKSRSQAPRKIFSIKTVISRPSSSVLSHILAFV